MAAHQAPLSLGFSRQEHWNGLLFPSPMHESESEVTQSCPTPSYPMDCSLPGPSVQGFARQEYWNGLPLLMFGAWQMEIPPGYNFLLFPIGRLWERAGEGCSACSSDLSSSHWILALRCKRIIGWPELMRVQFKTLTSSTRIQSFSELYNQTLESVNFFF